MRRSRGTLVILVAVAVWGTTLVLAPLAHGQVGDIHIPIEREVLVDGLMDPVSVDVALDGRVVVAERTGRVKVWREGGTIVEAGRLPVDAMFCSDCEEQLQHHGGISGLALSPEFESDNAVFIYWSPAGLGDPDTNLRPWRLSRFILTADDELLADGEQVLLEIDHYWQGAEADGNHRSGGIDFLGDGTLILGTGDDTMPRESNGYTPRDMREGRDAWNAERTSQDPSSRLGALLRLNRDGTVPPDNPHVDDPAYDPYVYAKGFRQPWRIAVDPLSETVLVGNVGPDANAANPTRGPAGMEEYEEVPLGGGTNHGWPRCIGDNEPYHDYDFETGQSHGPLSCEGFVPAPLTIPRSMSLAHPTLGTGGSAIIAGVVYRYEGEGALALPESYRGQLFAGDWVRNNLFTVPVDSDGRMQPAGLQRLLLAWENDRPVQLQVRKPTDMSVGADGAIYMSEYGTSTYSSSNGRLSRLKCAGCVADPAADFGVPLSPDVVSPLRFASVTADAPPQQAPSGVTRYAGLAVVAIILLGGARTSRQVT